MKENGELAPASGMYMREFSDIDAMSVNMPVLFEDTFIRSASDRSVDFRTRHIPAYDGNYARLSEDIAAFSASSASVCVLCATSAEAENLSRTLHDEGYTVASEDYLPKRSLRLRTGRGAVRHGHLRRILRGLCFGISEMGISRLFLIVAPFGDGNAHEETQKNPRGE